MAIGRFQKLKGKEFSLLSAFVISLTVTMMFCVINKSERLFQSEVLAPETLSLLKFRGYSKGTLFLYIIQKRIWIIPFLFLMSTTYLAAPMVYGTIVGYGIALGSILSIALLRYGGKGVLLLLLCSFPQYIFYLPAWIVTFRLSVSRRITERRFFLQLFVLEMVVLIGCFFESFINSMILSKVIKIFIRV